MRRESPGSRVMRWVALTAAVGASVMLLRQDAAVGLAAGPPIDRFEVPM